MTFEEILPLVTVLVGGALAVVGGFISQFFLKRWQLRSEQYTRTANKLEHLGRLASQIYEDGRGQAVMALDFLRSLLLKQEGIEAISDKKNLHINDWEFLVIVKLYVPKLYSDAKNFIDSVHDITGLNAERLAGFLKGESHDFKEKIMDFSKEGQKLNKIMETKYNIFMNGLSDIFKTYRRIF